MVEVGKYCGEDFVLKVRRACVQSFRGHEHLGIHDRVEDCEACMYDLSLSLCEIMHETWGVQREGDLAEREAAVLERENALRKHALLMRARRRWREFWKRKSDDDE